MDSEAGQNIRARAIVLLFRGHEVLLVDYLDEVDGPVWGVPGGGIEYGERAEDAARREVSEELGIDPGPLAHIRTFENIFRHGDELGHEVCFAFSAAATGTDLAERELIHGVESDGSTMVLRWVDPADVLLGTRKTWPRALPQLLLLA